MKSTKHQTNLLGFILTALMALCASFGYLACSVVRTHHKDWIGVFMFDSVTAGAVLLEYDESSPKNNTFGNVDRYNVNVDLFRYDFRSGTLKKDRTLFKNMKDATLYRVTDYNPPYLLQGASYVNGDNAVLFNLETGEKKILGVRVDRLSREKKFYTSTVMIIGAEKLDTLLFLDNHLYLDNRSEYIYFYSDKTNQIVSFQTERTAQGWSSRFVSRSITNTETQVLSNLPTVYFEGKEFINWGENKVFFDALYADSASVACDIDSLLTGKTLCDTLPRTLPFKVQLTGSFKTHHFIGKREDGLYVCTGRDTCHLKLISDGGYSEK